MKLGQAIPMLGVSDIRRTIEFYCKGLGCSVDNTFEHEGKLAWACIDTGSGEVMLMQEGPEHINESGREARRDVILYFKPDDVAALHGILRGRNLKCTDLRVTVYGMKEFNMEDPDGYQIWFGQPTDEPCTVRE